MNVVVSIPDQLAIRLSQHGPDLGRQALEALVLENVRSGRMTADDARDVLGLQTLNQIDGFLKAHGVFEAYTAGEVERQVETLVELGL